LDPHDEYIRGREKDLCELLSIVTIFLPSRQEARLMFGRDAPEDAARAFVAAGAKVAVIKLGAEGSLICFGSDLQHVPAVPVMVIDPTGAGDAYCGAFGVIYARSGSAVQAGLHASVAASFVVERLGATSALPLDRIEAERRLRLLTENLHKGSTVGGNSRP
jgi:ribokinase